ncbi:flagellin [Alsobacter sp. KACC 23698]|uniref:Flagellin n=1 Tax=Alsobacter sp. KACC 23698 TaxID=3149229 RepID=A0AAU7JAU2_9HYPH
MATAISSGVRNALNSLTSVGDAAQAAQQHLATGRKVNTATDNAVNYFTNISLNSRADQFTGLLDGMSNAVQTINSASKGIDSITTLIKSAQSTVKQMQAEATANRPTKTGTALTTAAESALTGKSIKDTTLDKLIGGASAVTATASVAGNLGAGAGVATALTIVSGSSTYTSNALSSTTSTVRDFINEINKSGLATASINDSGQLVVNGVGSNTVQIGYGQAATNAAALTAAQAGTGNTAFGLATTDYTTGVSASGGNSAVRSNLIQQFNDLRTQIDNLGEDAGYNGTNLLAGNKLSVTFNEKTGSDLNKLDVQGQTITSSNLGLLTAGTTTTATTFNVQNDTDLSTVSDALTTALASLKSTASSLGSSLSIVQARQDFSKSLISNLQTGADSLVNADQNQEAATLLALQTRQQLSQTALSLSNQAAQGVLRLF